MKTFKRFIPVLLVLMLLLSFASCKTYVSFRSLKPSKIEVDAIKSVALIPFNASASVSYKGMNGTTSASLISSAYKQDYNAIMRDAKTKAQRHLVKGNSSTFASTIAKQFTDQFHQSLINEELFIVMPPEDVQKAMSEAKGLSALDIGKKLNVAAVYTGSISTAVQDTLTTRNGRLWKYDVKVTKTVNKTVTDSQTGQKKVVPTKVTSTETRGWFSDSFPPKHLNATYVDNQNVFAISRRFITYITYKLIRVSDGAVLSTRTYTAQTRGTPDVILYNCNVPRSNFPYSFQYGGGDNVLAYSSATVNNLAKRSYAWITAELKPQPITVKRALMRDESDDKEQKKTIKALTKEVKNGNYDSAEVGFRDLWETQKNIAAGYNLALLMERKKNYDAALALMDELVKVAPTEDLRKRQRILKVAAKSYAKAMEQKRKIENNAIKIQKKLEENGYKIKVEVTDAGIKLTLDDIKFKPNSAEYMPSEESKLQKLGGVIDLFPQYDVLLIGHSAKPKGADANVAMDLSKRRAQSIADYFINSGKRTEENVFAEGKGFNDPIAPNDTPENMAKNRRIEMTFLID